MFDFALRSCGATVHIILQLASLCNMSIGRGVILAVAFQKVDAAPHTKAAAQGDDQSLQYIDGTVEELHKIILPGAKRGFPQTTLLCPQRSFQK